MLKKYACAQFAAGVLAALVLIAIVGQRVSPVWASPAGPHAYSAPGAPAGFDGASPLMVPAAAFRPDGNTSTEYYFPFPLGYIYGTNAVTKACLFAPVHLPVGAIIDRVMTSFIDNDATADWSLQFRRLKVTDDTLMTLATVNASTHGTSMQVLGAQLTANNVVPSQYYAYYLTTCLSTNERFYSARVYFDVNQVFTPLITK